jgi:hypothetical protein
LERDIMRLKKFAANQGPSQESLKTNEVPEPPQETQQQQPENPASPPVNRLAPRSPQGEGEPVM